MTSVLESVVIKSIEFANRIRLPYVEQGDPAGVPVVLLHGYSDSWRSYERVLPHLPPSLRAFAITQRGHGEATRPETGYRTDDLAADVAAFLDAQGIDAAVIVGHSMGSTVAQQFACDYPQRARGIVLVGAFATMKNNPDVAGLQEVVARLTDPVDPEFVREFQQSTLARPVPPAFFETVQRESLKMPARVWKAALADLMESDFSARLETITGPTLVIWGDKDIFSPRQDQEVLVSRIPDSGLLVYEGCGHSPQWEAPERFAADLIAFVEGIGGGVRR